jgi:iron complex outermembrane recepter protein
MLDELIDRKYTDPFPSAAVTFNKNPMNQWSFTYSRRIDRPSYQNLNPFEFNLDKYTFQRGNPNLRPQYTNSFAVTNTFKYRFNTTLNYSHVKDVFSTIPEAESSKALITTKNVADQDIVSLNISVPLQFKWYGIYANLNSYYSRFMPQKSQTSFIQKVEIASFQAYVQQTFKLAKTTTGEISAFYQAPSVWQGAFKSKRIWGVDAGLQQQVLKGKATVKASVTDIFQTVRWSAENKITGQILNVNGGSETRQFRINFNYRFGSNLVKQARQRKSSVEEENKRTQGGGGIGAQ